MAFEVTFNLLDEFNRRTTRRYGNTSPLIADVLTDVGVHATALDLVTEGGLESVNITQRSTATTFAATTPSNIDENASLQVLAGDTFKYDFNLPMPIAALRLDGGIIDTGNANLLAYIALFNAAGKWRINTRVPTDIVSIIKGVLDK